MNNLFERLNPIITKVGLDKVDEIETLKGPCKIVGIRPAHLVFIFGVVSIGSIIFGIAARFLSTILSIIYPTYRSIQAIESEDKGDDKQWLSYWILFSIITLVDLTIGLILEFIPFYHVLRLGLFVYLFHPSINGAKKVYMSFVQPVYLKYHEQIDQKLEELSKQIQKQNIH